MNRPEIKLLSPDLINKIAAGEVVERPASVVKELVENAIDAKSTHIKVELVGAGIKKITVSDNGIGMNKDDIEVAVKPHATSKIKNLDDLFSITSLGFRGEALPSISSISKMTITSSTNSLDGFYCKYAGGVKMSQGATSALIGTKVEVEDLFYNTPARLKHLSSEVVELSHITTLVNRFALANPNIKFTLINNQKVIYQTDGQCSYESLIAKTYGNDASKCAVYFEGANSLYHIKGYTTNNNLYRSNKNAINIIINNRIIRNLNLIFAVTDAYKSIIPVGKYPITILEIDCDPSLIDVNVHPSKLEIRFTDELELRALITKTISNAIYQANLVYQAKSEDFKSELKLEIEEPFILNEPQEEQQFYDTKLSIDNKLSFDNTSLDDLWNMFDDAEDVKTNKDKSSIEVQDVKVIEEKQEEVIQAFELPKKTFSSLRYIGQYHQTYLIFEDDDDLYLIDQHAAMERCQYEKIKKSLNKPCDDVITLLIPFKIELPISEVMLVLNKLEELATLGFIIEHFGQTTLLVRQIPSWVPKNLEEHYTLDVINHLINHKDVNRSIMNDALAKSLACKSSIKAHMHILDDEVKSLLEALDDCQMPYTCPHGRPTLVKMSTLELEKLFKRVL